MRFILAFCLLVGSSRAWTLASVGTTQATRFASVPYVLQMSVNTGNAAQAFAPSTSSASQLWQQDTSSVVTVGGFRLKNLESGLCAESFSTAPMVRMTTCQTNFADQEFTTAATSCTGTPTGYSCTDVSRFKSEYSGTNTLYLSIASDGVVSLQADDAADTKQWMNLVTDNPCDSTDCYRCTSAGINALANICGWCETRKTCELGTSTDGYVTCADWNYDNTQCLLPQDGTYQARFCTGTGGTITSTDMFSALDNAASAVANNLDNYLLLNCQDMSYTTWFGTITGTRYSTVTTGFSNIRADFTNGGFVLICDTVTPTCQASNYAYVYPGDPGHNVHICPIGMQSSISLQVDSLPGTLIHEFSHFDDIRGTDDFVYGTVDAQGLAASNPDEAVLNADNYEYFSEFAPGPCTGPPIASPPPSPGTCTANPTANSQSSARTLDMSSGSVSLSGLRLCSSSEELWYQFTVPIGTNSINVYLSFVHSDGDVDVRLRDSGGSTVASSLGITNSESIVYSSPSSGTYYVQILVGSTTGVSISGSVSFNGPPPPTQAPRPPPPPPGGRGPFNAGPTLGLF